MQLRFSKMHGLGNDFVVIDLITQRASLSAEKIRQLGDRYTGIGFDQLLLVEMPSTPEADFRYRIFNRDGNEVEHCGNGARCFARFVHNQRLTGKRSIIVETAKGNITLHVLNNDDIKVDMGVPVLTPTDIPFVAPQQASTYHLNHQGQTYQIGAVSMGNPHMTLLVDDINTAPVEELGSQLTNHASFPNEVNVGFMQPLDRNNAHLRVYERGVGETKACGTGACAAVATGIIQGILDSNVKVHLTGGELHIEWPGLDQPLYMTGSANHVYEGKIHLPSSSYS